MLRAQRPSLAEPTPAHRCRGIKRRQRPGAFRVVQKKPAAVRHNRAGITLRFHCVSSKLLRMPSRFSTETSPCAAETSPSAASIAGRSAEGKSFAPNRASESYTWASNGCPASALRCSLIVAASPRASGPLKLRASPCFCTFATVATAIGPNSANASLSVTPACSSTRTPAASVATSSGEPNIAPAWYIALPWLSIANGLPPRLFNSANNSFRTAASAASTAKRIPFSGNDAPRRKAHHGMHRTGLRARALGSRKHAAVQRSARMHHHLPA